MSVGTWLCFPQVFAVVRAEKKRKMRWNELRGGVGCMLHGSSQGKQKNRSWVVVLAFQGAERVSFRFCQKTFGQVKVVLLLPLFGSVLNRI